MCCHQQEWDTCEPKFRFSPTKFAFEHTTVEHGLECQETKAEILVAHNKMGFINDDLLEMAQIVQFQKVVGELLGLHMLGRDVNNPCHGFAVG